jgi:hypothetical protein
MRIEKSQRPESVPGRRRDEKLPDHFPVPPIQSQYRPPPALRVRPVSERTAFKPPAIFGREALNIFDPAVQTSSSESQILKTWKRLRDEELKTLVTHPPTNAFEEMIQWTEQGKLWKYPIDNEYGEYQLLVPDLAIAHDHHLQDLTRRRKCRSMSMCLRITGWRVCRNEDLFASLWK